MFPVVMLLYRIQLRVVNTDIPTPVVRRESLYEYQYEVWNKGGGRLTFASNSVNFPMDQLTTSSIQLFVCVFRFDYSSILNFRNFQVKKIVIGSTFSRA
jgi:hypothetical protein